MPNDTKCSRCGSDRILFASAKCSDRFYARYKDLEHDGYAIGPGNINEGDYLDMEICLECGQAQGKWPYPEKKILKEFNKH